MFHKSAALLQSMLALVATLGFPIASAWASGPHALALGQARQVLTLRPLVDVAEGITIDPRGHIFVSNNRLENDKRVCEILERSRDGTVSVFATLDPSVEDTFPGGVTGLAFDARGDLYAALPSFNPATHGVWRIRRNGEAKRLAGSRRMRFANALALDLQGNLYVTDSIGGAVWRFPPGESGHVWIRHPLLAPDGLLGANGIAFVPPNNLYVANTDRGLIAWIRIRPDGSPAKPRLVAAGYELLGIDGLAADARGALHAVIVVSTASADAFDLPTSLAFGRGPLDHGSVFVVNSGSFPEGRPEAAPGVSRVGVGVGGAR